MTNGLDPAYERTVQVFEISQDSGLATTTDDLIVILGSVPAGQNWLIERFAVVYRPGDEPTDDYVALLIGVPTAQQNAIPLTGVREATQLLPAGGWTGVVRFYDIADEASPVRFYSGEVVAAIAPSYAGTLKARLVVNAQVRAVVGIEGAGQSFDTTPIDPLTPEATTPADPNAWN